MARTAAYSRSGMDEYELHGRLSEQLSRAIGNYLANFSSSVSSDQSGNLISIGRLVVLYLYRRSYVLYYSSRLLMLAGQLF